MTFRPLINNREGYAQAAALENIQYRIGEARRAVRQAQRELDWLLALEIERKGQVERGEWP